MNPSRVAGHRIRFECVRLRFVPGQAQFDQVHFGHLAQRDAELRHVVAAHTTARRELVIVELAAAGLQPVFTAHLASVLKSMALEGRGLAWLPQSLVREDLDAGRLEVVGPREAAGMRNLQAEVQIAIGVRTKPLAVRGDELVPQPGDRRLSPRAAARRRNERRPRSSR